MREYLHAKIHNATITEANVHYIGSITIDEELLKLTDLHIGEKVLVADNTNGARLETYIIPGKK
jgi:aspartate 1-decarboxylase